MLVLPPPPLFVSVFLTVALVEYILELGKIFGQIFCKGVRTMGRHAHTTAQLASMVVHIVLMSVPALESLAWDETLSVVKRRIDVAKTKIPRPKTPVRARRWRRGK